jgi:hypothetical protein
VVLKHLDAKDTFKEKRSNHESTRTNTDLVSCDFVVTAFCLLLTTCCFFSNSTNSDTNSDASSISFPLADTAAEPAPVGRSDFVSRVAV